MGIHRAARVGNLSAVQDAIRKGEDINSVDEVKRYLSETLHVDLLIIIVVTRLADQSHIRK